jgi:Uma2 family endonuclease
MAVATDFDTVQDLLDSLDGIPPSRVLLNPAPGTATEADVIRINESKRRLCELVDGVLVEKGMGYVESVLAVAIAVWLHEFVVSRNLGVVSGEAGMVRLFPGRIHVPDVAYASWDRFPGGTLPNEPVPTLAPELVVEVLGESNTKREMELKRQDYFAAGVEVVWEIDPDARTAEVYRRLAKTSVRFDSTGILQEPEFLPGFELPLSRLFGELDRRRDPQ